MKNLPFSAKQLEIVLKDHPTPFHIYDEKGIRSTTQEFRRAFKNVESFKNYFAVKALPNPRIMEILFSEGMGMDSSSYPELLLCEKIGVTGEDIMFTSNDTPLSEYKKAKELGAIINLDDIGHIEKLEKSIGLPDLVSLRYNPGLNRKGGENSSIIGAPEEAKFGVTREQLFKGYTMLKEKGVKRFGLHTMVASNELKIEYFFETAEMLFPIAAEITDSLGIEFDFINLGGGIGVPYKPGDEAVDLTKLAVGISQRYKSLLEKNGKSRTKIYMENGRVVTGPHGYLVTTVLHLKETYKKFVGTDASMANLMRPGMYGAYHHITVLHKDGSKKDEIYDVVGSLCENNDKFAVDRSLPKLEEGDILIIHDTGAHGHAMGFNYNGKLRSAELLLTEAGDVKLIRRAETPEDYFATLII